MLTLIAGLSLCACSDNTVGLSADQTQAVPSTLNNATGKLESDKTDFMKPAALPPGIAPTSSKSLDSNSTISIGTFNYNSPEKPTQPPPPRPVDLTGTVHTPGCTVKTQYATTTYFQDCPVNKVIVDQPQQQAPPFYIVPRRR
jgi:hypothetical protein